MVRHEQSGDDLAIQNMPFHDLCDVGFRTDPVPYSLRIDHDARTQLAMVQTAGLIGSNRAFDSQPLHLFFKEGMQSLRSLIGTAPARVAFRSLIDTDKNMMGEGRHESTFYVADADKGWP